MSDTKPHASSSTEGSGSESQEEDSFGPVPSYPAIQAQPDIETGLYKSTSHQINNGSILEKVADKEKITLVWRGLSATVPVFTASKRKAIIGRFQSADAPSKTRQILYNIKGLVRPGEVLALMGPSGSGKTSLISILGGRVPAGMQVTGDVLFNGAPLSRAVKRDIGYVLQDDRLFDALTVYETLIYAARLRLPRDMPLADKRARVEGIIKALGIEKCRDTLIGGPMRRGVSGGERKRVSVGHELLINPSVLMLDEPTSGLDSTTAMNLVVTLRSLATRGDRTVITTIHQPSSRLYQQLDRLLLMSDGHVMYSGRGASVHVWFETLGQPVPFGVNVADFILDMANGEIASEKSLEVTKDSAAKERLIDVSEKFLERVEDGFCSSCSPDAKVSQQEDLATLELIAQGNGASVRSDRSLDRFLPAPQKRTAPKRDKRAGASYFEQLRVLCVRSAKTQRFEALSGQKFIQLISVAFIAGLFWWDTGSGNTLRAASDTASLCFFQGIFMSFNAMFAALFTFPSELGMLLKERSSDMYRLSAFYIARTASTLPLDLAFPSVFTLIVYWMGGLRSDAGVFISHWLSLMLGVLTAQTFGLLIGAAVRMVKQAQTVATIVILSFMLVGGFWVRDIPDWISWLRYGSFIFWIYSLLTKLQFRDRQYYDCNLTDDETENDIGQIENCAPVDDIQRVLNLPNDPQETPWIDIGVLFLMLIVLRFAVYLVLLRRTRKA